MSGKLRCDVTDKHTKIRELLRSEFRKINRALEPPLQLIQHSYESERVDYALSAEIKVVRQAIGIEAPIAQGICEAIKQRRSNVILSTGSHR
jgi:hypothetical protein